MNLREALKINSQTEGSNFMQAKAAGYLDAYENFKQVLEDIKEHIKEDGFEPDEKLGNILVRIQQGEK
jgi:hypothetical protein